ncbi:helix-turn-helix domain-containing protein [Sphingomonas sp. SUN019]|uniref:helix-turn-helix domain-containing protein n=1 Tax=Sphingomonas sp. SUN019 TaxID=2937788 RepID=UPI0021647909|nr:helix-turn-helix domain-containing protein [Sphingomonas sp. SUN019]UVO51331.1 helix-turn-helix domain-containing protein [Sphingomonas sp. SUN019]
MTIRPIRVRSHDDGRDRWRIAEVRPAPALAGIVDRYAAWTERTQSFSTRRELASTGGVFIVNLGAPLEIVDALGQSHLFAAGEGFAGGMAEATSLSRSTGDMAGVHIHLPVPRLAALLGVSIADLGDRVVRLSDLPGAVRVLGERLAEAADDDARFGLLDRFVTGRAGGMAVDAGVHAALGMLGRAGPRPVERAADALGWSRKRLARRVRDATGLLPRAVVRLARFERFAEGLATQPDETLAEHAAAAGYADQAHLTRDVRRLAATTPADLRARLIPAAGGVRHD